MLTLDIFCTVIDNYGDVGVCLHLARTLSRQGYKIRLWCDQLEILEQIQNKTNNELDTVQAKSDSDLNASNLEFKAWTSSLDSYTCPDVVINAFNCRLNPVIIKAIQEKERSKQAVVVINLEYLSAEDWIEDCHGLMSPADGISCYYFFPGFTARTGGLNVDQDFTQRCLDLMIQRQINPTYIKQQSNISLFSYMNPAVETLVKSFAQGQKQQTLKVFQGLPLENLNHILHTDLKIGQNYNFTDDLVINVETNGEKLSESKLRIEVLPMLSQARYDEILLTSCCNLVRGEDSIIRAMHTGQPFLWQIYKQDENAHIVKLKSFIKRMHNTLVNYTNIQKQNPDFELNFAFLQQCLLAYNEAGPWPQDFSFDLFMQRTGDLFYHFAQYLCSQEPLHVRLGKFVEDKLSLK